MVSASDPAFEAGRIAGQVFIWVALLAGALKCWLISRRPTTNAKCVLSLMLVLLAFAVASASSALTADIGTSPVSAIGTGLLGVAAILLLITAIVLAILGLVEFYAQRGVYIQGNAQAIWALSLIAVLFVCAGVGFVAALQRSLRAGAEQSRPGKILTFDDLNFRFSAPDRPWITFNASTLNKDSKVSFMRQGPEEYFFIIAEKLGTQSGFDSQQLADLGKAHMQAAAASARVVSERTLRVRGLEGLLVDTEAQIGMYQLHYRNWYVVTNGFAYQLVAYCRTEDQQRTDGELEGLLSRFELIDPNRMAVLGNGFATNFYSPRHHYAATVANSTWHRFAALDKTCPMAEFGASQGDSCFVVIPASLKGQELGLDALAASFLATMNIAYPNENLTGQRRLSEGDLQGEQFDFSRDLNGIAFHYRFKILQGNGEGYLVAAWTQRRLADAEAVFTDAFARVQFSSASNSFELTSSGNEPSAQELKTQAFVLNQAGLYHGKQGDYEKALPLYRAAAQANSQESIYVINALSIWQHLDRPKEALAFIDTLPANQLALPEIRANQAWFQAEASFIEPAVTNYAALFAAGYRSNTDFTEYVNLLAELKNYDAALAAVQDYLKTEDSVAVRLLEAEVYRLKKDLPKAISLLKDLRQQAPFNTQVANALAETFILAGQFTEALGISQDLIRDNGTSANACYLKGRSELGLKWYREAKSSFAEAARLAPANKDIRSYLDYVNGLLGEGENTALMEPIDPVALPALLTNAPVTTPPVGYATNYGAYYVRRILAASYTPGKERKTTDYMLARMLDASGVSAFSTVQIAFDPLSEQIFVNEVRVLDADGKTISTGNVANYYVLDEHTAMAVSQKKVLNIPVPGLQPGCQLSVTVTHRQQGRMDEFPFVAHTFSSTVPVRESLYFLAGDGHDLSCRTSPPMEPQKLPEGLCWRVADPVVARWEPLQPPVANFLPMLWISGASGQWSQAASNYLASISDRLEPDAALQSQSQKLTEKLGNPDAKIALLASYVQTNLTYKAIEFGRRARIPNKPADILRNKYGDCKDHAVLLQQMLAAAGVPAQLALVSHNGPIQKDLPSLDQFDHMIVYVPGSGSGRFLDCTSKGADVAQAIPEGLSGQDALVLDARNPRFVSIPQYPANASTISVEQHLHLVDQADLAVEESLTVTGAHAAMLRDYLLEVPESSRRTMLQNWMGMNDADLTAAQIDSLTTLGEPLHLRFTYALKKQFRRSDDQLRGVLRGGFSRSYLTVSPVEQRRLPFEITIPFSLETKVFIDVPAGFHPQRPENVDLVLDPRFATGQGAARIDGQRLNLDFKCRLLAGKFKPADYAAYRQTMAQALSFLEREVVFKRDGH
jgi:tetratricopeptide (TPR) repeat protein